MMNLTSTQFAALQRFKPVMEGFAAVQTFLDDNASLASLQQAHDEASARLDDKRVQEAGIDVRLADVKAKEDAAQQKLDDAETGRDNFIAEARTAARQIIDDAHAEAVGIVQQGRDDSATITAPAQQEKTRLEVANARAQIALDALNVDITAKTSQRDDLENQIATAKDRISQILKV